MRQKISSDIMKAQLSLEFILIFVAFVSIFIVLMPSVRKAIEVSDYSIQKANANVLLSKISNACKRVLIEGTDSQEQIEFFSTTEYNISSSNSVLSAQFSKNNISHDLNFLCNGAIKLKKGKNVIAVRNSGTKSIFYVDR